MTDLQKRLSEVFGYTGGKWERGSCSIVINKANIIVNTIGNEDRANAILISKAPEMLDMLWEHLPWRDIKFAKRFFLSLYQEIHGEEISWEELKNKIEGDKK